MMTAMKVKESRITHEKTIKSIFSLRNTNVKLNKSPQREEENSVHFVSGCLPNGTKKYQRGMKY